MYKRKAHPLHPMHALVSVFLAFFPIIANAQNIMTGTVVDNDGVPVIGAGLVCRESPSDGTVTDLDGQFVLRWDNDKVKTVVVSAVGMVTVEYPVREGGMSDVRIVMEYEKTILDQAVVTGYAQTTVKRITGSVGILNAETFKAKPVSSVSSLMQGEIAGVSVSATSGQPGTQSKIRIRGTNTLSGGSPLWVVDGVPLEDESPSLSSEELATGGFDNIFVNGIGNINPNDIESITVLKDAAAAAIYGSRAANGVIVVTTKRGVSGRMRVSYSNSFSWSFRPQRDLSLMNSAEKLAWEQELWDEFSASGYSQSLTSPNTIFPIVGIIGQIRAGVGDFSGMKGDTEAQDKYIRSLASTDTNWYDLLFRNAFSHNHHLSLSGGSDRYTYYVSLGFNDDNGMLLRNRYQRYSLTSNITITPAEWMKIDLGIDSARQSSVMPFSYVDPFEYAYFANPYEKAYNDDGTFASDHTYFSLGYYNGRGIEEVMPENGFSILRELQDNTTSTTNWSSTIRGSVDIRIAGPVKFTGLASYSFSNGSTDKVTGKDTYTAFRDRLGYDDKSQTNLYGSIAQNRTGRNSYVARGHFSYNDTFNGLHTVSVIAGSELRGASSNTIFTKRYNYDPVTGTTSLPPISGPEEEWLKQVERLNGEYFSESRYASFYASADYYMGERFVFNASFRTDGSSNFGSDRQFNPTWSAGAAWHIDRERWMSAQKAISHATLRLAYGYTGDISTSATHRLVMQYRQQVYRYYGDETYLLGTIPSAPNPDLGWEKTRDMKAGLDIGFLKDRITINTEGYYRYSSDVVTTSQVMSTTGFTYVYFNSADIMNSGIETTVNGTVIRTPDWKLSLSANFAYNYNRVLKYSPAYGASITSKDRYVEGYPIGAILAGKYIGIDTSSGLYSYKLRPDADVAAVSDLNKADNYRYYLGTTIAPYTGGFNITLGYRFLKLSISGVYSFGAKVFDKIESPASYYNAKHEGAPKTTVQSQFSDLYSNHLNVRKDRTDRWTEADPYGHIYPRIYDHFGKKYDFESYTPMDHNIIDSIYLKDVSYMRIKSIIMTADLPEKWIRKIRLSSASFNISLNNFFTFTSYDGMDPEVPGATYPTTRSVSCGMSIGF